MLHDNNLKPTIRLFGCPLITNHLCNNPHTSKMADGTYICHYTEQKLHGLHNNDHNHAACNVPLVILTATSGVFKFPSQCSPPRALHQDING